MFTMQTIRYPMVLACFMTCLVLGYMPISVEADEEAADKVFDADNQTAEKIKVPEKPVVSEKTETVEQKEKVSESIKEIPETSVKQNKADTESKLSAIEKSIDEINVRLGKPKQRPTTNNSIEKRIENMEKQLEEILSTLKKIEQSVDRLERDKK